MNLLGINIKLDPQGRSNELYRRFIIPINTKH
jgi:hypothetical protein